LVLFFRKEHLFYGISMIEGHIESLSPDGIVHGWLRDTGYVAPSHIQVLHGDRLVAEAMASVFRPDLLRAGHGHGHYGFAARLRYPLPPGPCGVALHLPRHGSSAPMALHVPPLAPPQPVTVERLLAPEPGWTVADLLAAPACLDADANFRRMGAPRFVDALYRFVFDRWPSKAEARLHTDNLLRCRLTPQDLLVDLLASGERADLGPDLISPFDPLYPFTFELR
jgi:hypothetical protein